MAPSAATINAYTDIPSIKTTAFQPLPLFERGQAESKNGSDDVIRRQTVIGKALRAHVDKIDGDTCEVGGEEAFFVADLGEVYRQHLRWKLNLQRAKPHFGKSFDVISLSCITRRHTYRGHF